MTPITSDVKSVLAILGNVDQERQEKIIAELDRPTLLKLGFSVQGMEDNQARLTNIT